jgi:nucleotide-binding universal stress UspA family protein
MTHPGNDVEEILEHAARKNIDMIAMSSRAHDGVKHLLFGSVVERVLRHTSKPVLSVRCNGSA